MTKKKNRWMAGAATALLAFSIASWISSCDGTTGTPGYRKYDSLFLGISLGMDKKAFYDYCWEMNRKKIFTHGPANQEVEYMLRDLLDKNVIMRFYPSFYKDKIYEMPVTFTYEGWAPWNRSLQSDSLILKMLPVFERWYGAGFKEINHPSQGKVYFLRNDYRRINLFIRDDQYVQAVFTDMKAELEMSKVPETE